MKPSGVDLNECLPFATSTAPRMAFQATSIAGERFKSFVTAAYTLAASRSYGDRVRLTSRCISGHSELTRVHFRR